MLQDVTVHDGPAVIGGCGLGIRIKTYITAPRDRVVVLTILEIAAVADALHLLVIDVEVEGMIVCPDRPLLYSGQQIEDGDVFIIGLTIETARAHTDGIRKIHRFSAEIPQVTRPLRLPHTACRTLCIGSDGQIS